MLSSAYVWLLISCACVSWAISLPMRQHEILSWVMGGGDCRKQELPSALFTFVKGQFVSLLIKTSVRERNTKFPELWNSYIFFSLVRGKVASKGLFLWLYMYLIACYMANYISCRLTVLVGSVRWVWGLGFLKIPLRERLDNKWFFCFYCGKFSLL